MHDQHLRPDEFELLLDGEEGFGVAPLRAHVRQCAGCTRDLEKARTLMLMLDALPDFSPSVGFSDRVMRDVQVFEPWYAAASAQLTQWVPESRPARIAAGIGAAISAGVLTAGASWSVARADIGLLLAQVGLDRLREQTAAATSDVFNTVLGQPGLDALRHGTPELVATTVGGFVAVVGLGVVGLRALASSGRRTR